MKQPQERFNRRTNNLPTGKGNFEIYAIANGLEEQGKEVIHMEIGIPDFPTPKRVIDAGIEALKNEHVYYTSASGVTKLKEAIVKREAEKNGTNYDAKTEIAIMVGASEALHAIWMTFLNPEDEVLIPVPYYNSYNHQLTYSDAKLVPVPIINDGELKFRKEDFEKRVTENTKMIVITNPNNPTGYVMTEEEIEMMAEFAIKHDLLVISDECYDAFVYDGKYKSIATLPGMRERTLVLNSASKTFAMTGWRIGYVLGREEYVTQIIRMHSHMAICAPSFPQYGAIEAYESVYEELEEMQAEFKARRDLVVEEMKKVPKVHCITPKGAFYMYFSVEAVGMTGMDFCEELLRDKGVAMSPGQVFDPTNPYYVRMSYTCSQENIRRGISLIKEFIEERV